VSAVLRRAKQKSSNAQGTLEELGVRSILDFGCAYGADVAFYRENGYDAEGYDIEPRFGRAEITGALYDLVTVVYVVNVLPTLEEPRRCLRRRR